MRLVADDARRTVGGQLTGERLRVLDSTRVVKRENTENIARREDNARLLEELGNAIFAGDERHDHSMAYVRDEVLRWVRRAGSALHDLNLSVGLVLGHVLPALHEVANELAGTGTSQLSRVILLFDETCLGVDHNSKSTDLCAFKSWPTRQMDVNDAPPRTSRRCATCRRAE